MQCLFLGSDAIVQEFDVLASFSQKIIQHGMFEERRLAHTWRSHAYHDVHNDGIREKFWNFGGMLGVRGSRTQTNHCKRRNDIISMRTKPPNSRMETCHPA
jgi:hypothetical protein